MKSLFSPRHAALALAVAATFGLSACQAPAKKAEAPATTAAAPAQAADPSVKQRELANGLYEMTLLPGALYVASADTFKDVSGGVIYRLNPTTLESTGKGYTDLKNFAMTTDGTSLFVTNTLDGGVSKIDPEKGKVLARTLFSERNEKGLPYGAREVTLHKGDLYIGGVGDPGVIWVVDATSMKLKARIKNAGKWVTGIIYSPLTDRLYAANGGGEILVINPRSHKIEKRLTAGDGKAYLFLNMAEDPATGRLFVTDNSKGKATLVFDERTGKVIKRIEGDALGIKFNAKRNEIYISQRESQKVLQLDATTYAVKKSWSFDGHPNSLLVTPDGETLYVSIKQGFNKDHSSKGPDSVARIQLN